MAYKINKKGAKINSLLDNMESLEPKVSRENDGFMRAADKNKLDNLPDSEAMQEQFDGKQDVITDLPAIRSGAEAGASAYQKPGTGIPSSDLSSEVQDMIENGGKTKSVSVNGGTPVTPDENGQVDLTVPSKTSDLENDSDFATKQEAQQMVDNAKIDTVSVDYQEDGGAPDASASFEDGELAFSLKNMKMKFSDLTAADKAELKGEKGDQGDSAVYDPSSPDAPDFVMANTTGQSTTKSMTQKVVTDELTIYDDIDISSLTEYNTYINGSNVWTSNITGRKCIFIPVVGGTVIHVMPNYSLTYAFLTSSSYNSNTSVSTYADGYTGTVNVVQSSGMQVLQVPSNAKFLYVVSQWESNDRKPSMLRRVGLSVKAKVDHDKSWSDDLILDDVTNITIADYSLQDNGTFGTSSTYKHGVIAVKEGEKFVVGFNASSILNRTLIIFATSAASPAGGAIPYVPGTTTMGVNYYMQERMFIIPSGCKYLLIYNGGGGSTYKVKKAFGKTQGYVDGVKADLESVKYIDIQSPSKYITMEGYAFTINGWSGNLGANNGCRFYPVKPGHIYRVGLDTNKTWQAFFTTKKNFSTGDSAGSGAATGESTSTSTGWKDKTAPQDAAYLYVRSKALLDSTWDCPNVREVLIDIVRDTEEAITEGGLNKILLANSAHWVSKARTAQPPLLGLLHYSDIHASTKAVEGIKSAIMKYGGCLDDILCTGDVVYTNVGYIDGSADDKKYGLSWWKESGLDGISLFSLGNHDCTQAMPTGGNPIVLKDTEWSYDAYFAEHISQLGYVMPEGYDNPESPYYKANYWHKDYADQKVRLICIDAIHHFDGIINPVNGEIVSEGYEVTSNAQELWLIDKLSETLAGSGSSAEGYSVVIASHFPLDDYGVEDYYGASSPYATITGDKDNKTWDDEAHGWGCNKNPNGGRVIDKNTGDIVSFQDYDIVSYTASNGWHLRNRNNEGILYKSYYNNIGEIIKYWMENSFVVVSDISNKNPRNLGWYEKVDDGNGFLSYKFTSDTSPKSGKTYYTGAKFVAWLSGHTHRDYMYYSQYFPNILIIGVAQAGDLRDEYTYNRNDVCLTANLVFIDTYFHYIKLIRTGHNNRYYLRPINYLCYNYSSRNVISQG